MTRPCALDAGPDVRGFGPGVPGRVGVSGVGAGDGVPEVAFYPGQSGVSQPVCGDLLGGDPWEALAETCPEVVIALHTRDHEDLVAMCACAAKYGALWASAHETLGSDPRHESGRSGPAKRTVTPSRRAPKSGVQCVAAVNNATDPHHLAHRLWVKASELLPVRQVKDQMCVSGGRGGRLA
jgi:hypothetical protein